MSWPRPHPHCASIRHVNATFNDIELTLHRDINLGVSRRPRRHAGRPVPTLAPTASSLPAFARAVNDVATRARNKQLKAGTTLLGRPSRSTKLRKRSDASLQLFGDSTQPGWNSDDGSHRRPAVAVNGMIGIKADDVSLLLVRHRVLDGCRRRAFDLVPQMVEG